MAESQWTVPEDLDGKRVDAALAALSGQSRSVVQSLVQAGLVTIAGKVVAKSGKVTAGQHVAITGSLPAAEVPDPPEVPIVYAIVRKVRSEISTKLIITMI